MQLPRGMHIYTYLYLHSFILTLCNNARLKDEKKSVKRFKFSLKQLSSILIMIKIVLKKNKSNKKEVKIKIKLKAKSGGFNKIR